MKLKKLVAMGLATTMTMTALTACGSKETAETTAATTAAAAKEAAGTEAPADTAAPAEETKGITFPLEETMTFTGYANYMSTEAGKGDLNDSEACKIVK